MANREMDSRPLGTRSEVEIEFSEIRRKIDELCQTPVGRDLASADAVGLAWKAEVTRDVQLCPAT